MSTEQTLPENKKVEIHHSGGSTGTVYGLGLIGAWVFYLKRATTTEEKVKGFFKGLVWPAFMVYEMLIFLNKNKE